MHTQTHTMPLTSALTKSLIGFLGSLLLRLPQSDATGKINLGLWRDLRDDDFLLPDHEGIYRTIPGALNTLVPGGVMPYKGARIVQNLTTSSEDMTGTGWGITSEGVVVDATTFRATKQYSSVKQSRTTLTGEIYRFTFEISNINGNTRCYLKLGLDTTQFVDISTVITRYSFLHIITSGGTNREFGFQDRGTSGWGDWRITNVQLERVEGQSNQNPGEYQKTDAANGFYGFGYYARENKNSVHDSVVVRSEGILVGVGDSLIQSGGTGEITKAMSGKLTVDSVINNGVGGSFLADVDTNFNADAVVPGADVVVCIVADFQDLATNENPAMQAAMQSIFAKCAANGIKPIIFDHPPFGNSGVWRADRQSWTDEWNAWLRVYVPQNGGLFVSAWDLLVDPGTYNIKSEYDSGDGLHPSVAGYVVLGEAAADAVGYAYIGDLLDPAPAPVHWPKSTNWFLNAAAPATQTITLSTTGSWTISCIGAGSAAIAANTAIGTGFGTATAGNDVTVDITTAGSVDVTIVDAPDYVQLENLAFSTPPIVTAGAAVSRDTVDITHPRIGYMNQPSGTLVMDVEYPLDAAAQPSNSGLLSVRGNSPSVLYHQAAEGRLTSTDGTNYPAIDITSWVADDKIRQVVRWEEKLVVGAKNITQDTAWQWDLVENDYDGEFHVVGDIIQLGLFAEQPLVFHTVDLYSKSKTNDEIEVLL